MSQQSRVCEPPWGCPSAARRAAIGASITVLVVILPPSVLHAAQVRGIVELPINQEAHRTLGYTRTRIASASPAAAARRSDVALFLRVKESLPIPPPSEPFQVSLNGLRFQPSVAACVIDGKVAFTNNERTRITLLVDRKPIAELAPGESKIYACTGTDRNARTVRVKEWPHMRGTLFVGELGVVGQTNASGAFVLSAPQGTYQLNVFGEDGVMVTQDIEVKGDLDLGRIGSPSKTKGTGPTREEKPVTTPSGQ